MLLLDKVKKIASGELKGVKKCAIGYSGGLDSTAMVMLLENLGIETTAVVLDIGQGADKFQKACDRSKKCATKTIAIDAKAEFFSNINKGIIANTILNGHMNSEGMSRPLIALHLSKIAKNEGCEAIAHGSSGTGNDQHRMENGLRALAPWARIIAPIRDWDLRREECATYLGQKGLKDVSDGGSAEISADESMWARTIRNISEKNEKESELAYKWTNSKNPKTKIEVEFYFENGWIKSAKAGNGAKKSNYEGYNVFTGLNGAIGACGFGRTMAFEDKVIGLKMAEYYEAPAAIAVTNAHRILERLTLTRAELEVKSQFERTWSKLVYEGNFYSRLRANIGTFLSEQSKPVTGTVNAEITGGSMKITGVESPNALYDSRMTNRKIGGAFDQKDARGFSKLYGLQESVAFMMV